jgi:hypothetical protein
MRANSQFQVAHVVMPAVVPRFAISDPTRTTGIRKSFRCLELPLLADSGNSANWRFDPKLPIAKGGSPDPVPMSTAIPIASIDLRLLVAWYQSH